MFIYVGLTYKKLLEQRMTNYSIFNSNFLKGHSNSHSTEVDNI